MYQKNTFDVVITTKEDEKDKILKPNEACQLQSGSTYTYVNNFVKEFSIQDRAVPR